MRMETVRVSSKGQLVIPQDVRDELGVTEGSLFALVSGRDTILLKKIATPSKEALLTELEKMAKEGKKRLQQKGIKESDIPEIVAKARRNYSKPRK